MGRGGSASRTSHSPYHDKFFKPPRRQGRKGIRGQRSAMSLPLRMFRTGSLQRLLAQRALALKISY